MRAGRYAGPRRRAARRRARRRDVGVGAVVHVEERALRALEQDRGARTHPPVEEQRRVRDVRAEALGGRERPSRSPRPRRARGHRPAGAGSSGGERPRASPGGTPRRGGRPRGCRAAPPCPRRQGPTPLPVVPIRSWSMAWSSARWYGRITWAAWEMWSWSRAMPAAARPSSSWTSAERGRRPSRSRSRPSCPAAGPRRGRAGGRSADPPPRWCGRRSVRPEYPGDDVRAGRDQVDDLALPLVAPLGAHDHDVRHGPPPARVRGSGWARPSGRRAGKGPPGRSPRRSPGPRPARAPPWSITTARAARMSFA